MSVPPVSVPPHRPPCSRDVLFLGPKASVQFGGDRAIVFRVIRVQQGLCTVGWVWLDGFELNPQGDALERRTVFVQLAGCLDWETVRRAAVLRRLEREGAAAVRRAQHARNGRVPGQTAKPSRPRVG